MLDSSRTFTVGRAAGGYGFRLGPLLVPWLPAAAVFAVAGLAILSPVESDTWLALVAGRETWRHGLPSHEVLTSLAHGRDWVDQAWLGQVALYAAYSVGGMGAVAVAGRLAATLAAVLAVATAAQRRASPVACTLALLFGFSLLAGRNELRPQLLAEPLFAALLWLLADDVRRPSARILWAAPVVLVVWANVHGSVLLGCALVLLRVGFALVAHMRRRPGPPLRRTGWLALVALAAPFASPYGPRVVRYYDSVVGNGAFRDYLSEWWPTTPTNAPLAFLLIVWIVGLVAWQRRVVHPFDGAVLVATAAGALVGQRHVVWFALATIAFLPGILDGILPVAFSPRRLRAAPALCLVGALLGAAMLTRIATGGDGSLTAAYPRGANAIVSAAQRDPRSGILASTSLADWLLFEKPALAGRIAVDGRFELLTESEFTRYVETVGGSTRLATAFPGTRILVLDRDQILANRSRRQPGARVVGSEAAMVVITLAHAA